MYDKVTMFLPRPRETPELATHLESGKEMTDRETGETITFGSVGGLKATLYPNGLWLTGSLAKFLYPSNIYPLDLHTTAEAIEKLSDLLHVDMAAAAVTGLEFGTQFLMSKPIETYLGKLGDIPYLERVQGSHTTLYYRGKGKKQPKTLCFYDKRADAYAKGLVMPEGFADANLLKYELRLKGRLAKQIGVPEVQASTLYDRAFYRRLVALWADYYSQIRKQNNVKTDIMAEIKSVKDAFGVFVARLIAQSDQNQIQGFMDELKQAKVFPDPKYYSRLKAQIANVSKQASVCVADEDIRELDNEVKNVCAYI